MVRLIITPISITLPVPAGTFFPVFVAGAGIGRMFGEALADAMPDQAIDPRGYAIVGAASLVAGVTHTVSSAVIVYEITAQVPPWLL